MESPLLLAALPTLQVVGATSSSQPAATAPFVWTYFAPFLADEMGASYMLS